MADIIGVRFRDGNKSYYVTSDSDAFKMGDFAICESEHGLEYGKVVMGNKKITDKSILKGLKKIVRKAGKDDLKKIKDNQEKEKKAIKICLEKIDKNKLDMKLIDAEYTFDNSKLIFYFTANGRVDFRELVKDLASVFRTRIELRQIGVRDEAKRLGGLGICGKPLCCSSFLGEFQPVSIKMAKEQGLSLNPTKISGTCGRLMCCLKYESEAYEDLLSKTPKVGALVDTPNGNGVVVDNNLLTGRLTVKISKNPDAAPITFNVKEVKLIKDTKIKVSKGDLEKLKGLE